MKSIAMNSAIGAIVILVSVLLAGNARSSTGTHFGCGVVVTNVAALQTTNDICSIAGTTNCNTFLFWPYPTGCSFGPRSDGQWCRDKDEYGHDCTLPSTCTEIPGHCVQGVCILDVNSAYQYQVNAPYVCGSGIDYEICRPPGS